LTRKLGFTAGTCLMALAALPTAALAYTASSQANSTASTSVSSTSAGTPLTFTGHFEDASGNPVGSGAPISFSQQSGPSGCSATFAPTSTTTNANGDASTQVTLPANCPGTYVLAATDADPATVTASVRETGGFPASTGNGSAAPARSGSMPSSTLLVFGGAICLLAIGGAGLARRRS